MPGSPVDTRREYNKVRFRRGLSCRNVCILQASLQALSIEASPEDPFARGRQAALILPLACHAAQVAMQMGAPIRKKDGVATSPYGTPKGTRSPLSRCTYT